MAEELGERTEQPTGRRRSEARNRGQVARSQDLGASLDLIGGLILLVVMGASLAGGLAGILRNMLDSRLSGIVIGTDTIAQPLRWTFVQAGLLLGPFLLGMFAIALLGQLMQVGWTFTLSPLQPKFDRMNPMKGLGKIGGRRNIVKTSVAMVKISIVGTVAYVVVRSNIAKIANLSALELMPGVALMGKIVMQLCIWLLVVVLLIGLIDWWYQRWQMTRDLMMTKQEVKEEHKSMEGDIETKGRRLRMARQIALQRIQMSVPKADVIVTNPTHFAVALEYDGDKMAAPRVTAKGADYMAFRIREIAVAHGVPIVERPPLARALYHDVPVGRQVLPQFYEAVAEILAYVYRLEGRKAG